MINIPYKILFTFFLSITHLSAADMRALLFQGNCVTCHVKDRAHSAPSMMEVKNTYKSAFTTKEEFVNYMSQWIKKPNADTSLMSEAIQKYELMPELGYDLETLQDISSYIYDTDFSKN